MKSLNQLSISLFFMLFVTNVVLAQPVGKDIIIGQSFSIKSEILNEERPYQIYLPNDYDDYANPVSVLYLLDGDAHFHHTTGIVSFLKSQGKIPNFMVVSIPNTNDRTRDLTPAIKVDKDAQKNSPSAGGADNMLSFIKNELIPHIDKAYNTSPYRMLVGHSFGGIFAVHSLVTEPELFDAYISISPSMWWDKQNLVIEVDSLLSRKTDLNCFFYMTMGNEGGEMLGGAMKIAALFEETEINGFDWDFKVMKEETHGSIPHRSTYYGLEAIFEDWYATDLQKVFATGGLNEIKMHYKEVSKKLGFEMNPPESDINNLGYSLMQGGSVAKALEVFLANVEFYPNSFNVYDSAAEAYMVSKKDKLAIKYYEKSMLLNPGNVNGVMMLRKLGVDYDPKELATVLSKKEQKEYVGEYDIDLGGVLTIQIVDGQLTATHPAIPTQTMHSYPNNVFVLLPQNVPLTFTLDKNQKPSSFEVQMGVGVFAKGTKISSE